MLTPRHAAPSLITGLGLAAATLGAALAGVLGAMAFVSLRVARHVVTPVARPLDTQIVALDTAAQTITLSRTPDTVLPGRYGLFTTGTSSYLKLGSVLGENAATVTRKLLTHIDAGTALGEQASFSGWYFDGPEQLHVPFTNELISAPVGECPAWYFPAPAQPDAGAVASDVWVIQVHGRGASRAEGLRAVPVFRAAGIHSLLVSYRDDGEAPHSEAGTYGLGATEWPDVEAAIDFARARGARRVVVMGWSMGGAIALQGALSSKHADIIVALVLESPVIQWQVVLGHQGRLLHLPRAVTGMAMRALGSSWASGLTHTGAAIPFDQLDIVARSAELTHPILIVHSDDDGFVPAGASHALAEARPDLVTMHTFDVARHTKLWNYDQTRWESIIVDWLRAQGLTATRQGADS